MAGGFYKRAEIMRAMDQIVGERLHGRPEQDPYVESALQNYKIGARLVTEGGMVWHYSRAGSIGQDAGHRRFPLVSSVLAPLFTFIGTTPVGGKTVVIADTDLTHGKDYWAGGFMSAFPTSPDYSNDQPRMIKSSTPSNGTSVTITLCYPVWHELPNSSGGYFCRSQYAEVDQAQFHPHAGKTSIVGYPWMPVTPLHFVWLQTWGIMQPVGLIPGQMGITANLREVYGVSASGHPVTADDTTGLYVPGLQRIGYLMPDSFAGDEVYVMLQLDP